MVNPKLMAFLLSREVLSGVLVIATGSAEAGLLVLNRYLLLQGVFKFPYPIAATLIQCLITHIFVLVAEQVFRSLLALIVPSSQTGLPQNDKESLPYKDDSRRSSPTRLLRGLSPRRFGLGRITRAQGLWQSLREFLPLALVFSLKVGLNNVFMTYLTVPAYSLVRVGGILIAFAFNTALKGRSPSTIASISSLLAISSLFIAILPFTYDMALGDLVVGTMLSTFDALLPIMILRGCRNHLDAFPPDVIEDDHLEQGHFASPIVSQLRRQSSRFWSALRHASLLSTIVLIPIIFLTGEARHIWNDSYVLHMACVRQLFVSSGILTGTLLVSMSLLIMVSSPVTTSFLAAFTNAIQMAHFTSGLTLYSWLGFSGCWFFSVCFVITQIFDQWKESRANGAGPARKSCSFMHGVTIALVLCVSIFGVALVSWDHSETPAIETPSCENLNVTVVNLATSKPLQPDGNVHDDYLGSRPDADTVADLPLILERCEEVSDGLGVDDVIHCARFLAHGENEYFQLPDAGQGRRASERTLGHTISHFEDGEGSISPSFFKPSEAQPASISSIGTCPGPVFPYHVYWTGSATWRLELFVKAYLYTQNLPCSRLWIWLDSDVDPDAVNRMLCNDPIFSRFLPLVIRGDISLKAWKFPKRIPLPKDAVADIPQKSFHPHLRGDNLEMEIADSIIQDGTGKWLVLNPNLAHFTPVQISDAVRFIVLHLHGGVYFDMDVMLLRDMRPLLLQPQSFAEQWVERCPTSDFNTAVLSLPANSSLSTYLVRGGVRMGMNFHPKVIGRMMLSDGRIDDLKMLQNAVFDPLVTDLRRLGTENCTIPCHKNFEQVFKTDVEEPEKEWMAYSGHDRNRTLDKFFRGSFAYHIHNQWWKYPEPQSWMDVITRAHDGYFDSTRTNAYGEKWQGPSVGAYDRESW